MDHRKIVPGGMGRELFVNPQVLSNYLYFLVKRWFLYIKGGVITLSMAVFKSSIIGMDT